MILQRITWLWGFSSVGRALRSHRRGQGFESPKLHQMDIARTPIISKAALPYWCGCNGGNRKQGSRFLSLAPCFTFYAFLVRLSTLRTPVALVCCCSISVSLVSKPIKKSKKTPRKFCRIIEDERCKKSDIAQVKKSVDNLLFLTHKILAFFQTPGNAW